MPDPRVLHLFNVFGALTERVFLEYTSALGQRGWDLTAGYETMAAEAPKVPFPVVQLKRVSVEPDHDVCAQMQRVAEMIEDSARRSLLDQPFDLIHGHFGPRILQSAPWIARGVPTVLSVYGYDAGRLLRDPCWVERYRWAADRGATFVALADSMRKGLLRLNIPVERVRLIRLGINLDDHVYEPHPAPDRPRFVFVGRFVEKKGVKVLLDAMARLSEMGHQNATLELIGAGPLSAELHQQVARLRLADQVRFAGIVPFDQLLSRIQGASALVQPSRTAADGDAEGAPMVLMHAQAAGVPCITTVHSGNPEVLPPEGQRFVASEADAASLADAMRGMLELENNERKRLQDAGRNWIEKRFSLRSTVDAYDSLYRELIAAGSPTECRPSLPSADDASGEDP